MSLEGGYRPDQYDEFTTEQLDWLEGILKENYGKGHNIYVVQHALIKGYGPGDDLETPYYGGAINPELDTAKRFISLLEEYKDIVWILGHSHEDFSLGYNYTNNNGESCNMIHNSSVGNPTHVTDGKLIMLSMKIFHRDIMYRLLKMQLFSVAQITVMKRFIRCILISWMVKQQRLKLKRKKLLP